jgi:hypothetical protein
MSVIVEHRNFGDLWEQPLIYVVNVRARERQGLPVCRLQGVQGREREECDERGHIEDPGPQSHPLS